MSVELTALDDQRLKQAATTGPVLGSSEQDKRILAWLTEHLPPPPPAVTDIHIALSMDKSQGVLTAYPPNTAYVEWAYMPNLTPTAEQVKYSEKLLAEASPFIPSAADPVIDAIAKDANHQPLGKWASQVSGTRLTTTPVAPTPIEPPPTTASKVLPGVCVNSESGQIDWTRAKEDGCVLGRTDHGTFKANLEYAAAAGMKLVWIIHSITDITPTLNEFASFPQRLKEALHSFNFGNENWEGSAGIGSPKLSGEAYGKYYVAAQAAKRKAGIWIPMGLQVRLAPDLGEKWMASLVKTPGLKAALEGQDAYIDSHNYAGFWTSAQKEPTSYTNFTDTDGKGWGAQRVWKEVDYICDHLGLANIDAMVTEYGTASAAGVPDSVSSATAVAEHITSMGKHSLAVAAGTFRTGKGRVAKLRGFTYYDEYAWSLGGAESYGFRASNGSPRTEGGISAAWRAMCASLMA